MREKRGIEIYKVVMLTIITAIVTFLLTAVYLNREEVDPYKITKVSDSSSVSSFDNLRAIIEAKYLKDIDEEAMLEGAKKGYIEGIRRPIYRIHDKR